MKTSVLIALGICFLLAGLAFCGIAMYLGRPESVKKAGIAKPGSRIFYIIGVITFVMGLTYLVFCGDITKAAVQVSAVIYLAVLTVLLGIFSVMIKDKRK